MADYSAMKEYLSSQNVNYFTFHHKSLKPTKAVCYSTSARKHAGRGNL
jgi:hypothetical protein